MKTRSQTRKENLEKENRKVPRLNEDIFGIILKHVVRKEQENIMDRHCLIRDHFMVFGLEPGLSTDEDLDVTSSSREPSLYVKWPDYLNSNSRRLVHHTNVKLLWDFNLSMHAGFNLHVTTKEELDSIWKTFKHFGGVELREDFDYCGEPLPIWYYFRQLWTRIQARLAARDAMIEKLEKS